MKRDFLRLVKELDEAELREELRTLYERFPVLREYYRMELSGSTRAVVDKYKKSIRKAFFTGRRRMGKRCRSNSSRLLKEFAAVSIHTRDLVDLHFYRVATMVEAMEHYGEDGEAFYKSMRSSFVRAADLAQAEVLLDSFRTPAEAIVQHFSRIDRHGGGGELRRIFTDYWSA